MGRAIGGNAAIEERLRAAQGKRECLELARLLDRFPLRARKRRDYEIWSRAVVRWAASPYDTRRDGRFHFEMRQDADQLRRVRRYVKWPPPALEGPLNDLVAYFGGFFSGEGSFGLSGLGPRAVIKLRRDDRSILELFATRFGFGTVCDIAAYDNPNPSVIWTICATDDLAPAVRLFENAELRGRKRREFEVWRDAAHERAFAKIGGRRWDRARVAAAAERLTAMRTYTPPLDPARATSSEEAEHAAQQAHIKVLRPLRPKTPTITSRARPTPAPASGTPSGRLATRSRRRSVGGRGRSRQRGLGRG
jgi:hypothetical protein